jgi:hypothetical protein
VSEDSSSSDGGLIFQFAFEAFRPLRAVLEESVEATEVGRVLDMDWVQLEYKVRGALITLERDIWDGSTTVSAGARGRVVLESLRSVLDRPEHPVLEQIG